LKQEQKTHKRDYEKVIHAYPILVEAGNQRVAQAEHTFIPTEDGAKVTTSL